MDGAVRTDIHPGEHIADELAELGVGTATLAADMKVPPCYVAQLVDGRVPVDADVALELAGAFGTSAAFWMRLQADYDRACARTAQHKG